jgi:hypothetical protein
VLQIGKAKNLSAPLRTVFLLNQGLIWLRFHFMHLSHYPPQYVLYLDFFRQFSVFHSLINFLHLCINLFFNLAHLNSILFKFLAYLPYLKKMNVGLCDLHAVWVSLNTSPLKFWKLEPIFMKHGTYFIVTEPILTAYFINPSRQSVCLYVYLRLPLLGNGSVDTFPWQRIHAAIEELLEASFYIRPM